jgi:hypothetical protein
MLIPITVLFYRYCKACFYKHDIVIPLEHLSFESSDVDKSTVDLSPAFGNSLNSDSELRVMTNRENEIRVSIPQSEYADIRIVQDYQCPLISKPLPSLWTPHYIARLVDHDGESDTESMIRSFHSKHSVLDAAKWTSVNEMAK